MNDHHRIFSLQIQRLPFFWSLPSFLLNLYIRIRFITTSLLCSLTVSFFLFNKCLEREALSHIYQNITILLFHKHLYLILLLAPIMSSHLEDYNVLLYEYLKFIKQNNHIGLYVQYKNNRKTKIRQPTIYLAK